MNEIQKIGDNEFLVADIMEDLTPFLTGKKIDMTYIDPPWNIGILKVFYKIADKEIKIDFQTIIERIIKIVKEVSPRVNYMEMGKQHLDLTKSIIRSNGGQVTNEWNITYSRNRPAYLIRYSFNNETPIVNDRLNGMDDAFTPLEAINSETGIRTVLDLCTGLGATGKCALKSGKVFYGVELSKKRIDRLIEYYNKHN